MINDMYYVCIIRLKNVTVAVNIVQKLHLELLGGLYVNCVAEQNSAGI